MLLKKYSISVTFLFSIVIIAGLALFINNKRSLSTEDTSALVNGRLENGYEYVGYIISDKQKVCAATLIDQNTIITAAHCLSYNAGDNFSFGKGEFTTEESQLVNINLIKFADNYNPSSDSGVDLALAKLETPIHLDKYPTFGTPIETCNASIVAYGSGSPSKSSPLSYFKKKSGEGCIKAITDNFLIRFSREVGMCFGDSGGPIFSAKGSDQIIGILSGGLTDPELKELKCEPSNTGFAINLSSYGNFVTNTNASNFNTTIRIIAPRPIENFEESFSQFISNSDSAFSFQSDDSNSILSSSGTLSAALKTAVVLVALLTVFALIYVYTKRNG